MERKIWFIFLSFFAVSANPVLSYEGELHKRINKHAADQSNSILGYGR